MPRLGRREELRAQLDARRARIEAKNAAVTARAGRNLVFAFASGLIFAAVFLVSLFVWAPLLTILAVALSIACSIELASAMRGSGLRVPRVGVSVSSVIIILGAWLYGADGLIVSLFFGSAILVIWRLIEGLIPSFVVPWRTLVTDVLAGLFCLVYIPFLIGMALLVRQGERGEWWIFTLVLVVVCVDTGAYVAGITMGKHKMAPRVSPGKTWEGLVGGTIASAIAAILAAVFLLQMPWWIGLILGLVILVLATFGDLGESLIKRSLGIKDMSSWVPGHGGLLDRLDSILPSIIGVYGIGLAFGVFT
ncbi:MAG: phosphatidate cytidylyltransferase [Canibacter sp.]